MLAEDLYIYIYLFFPLSIISRHRVDMLCFMLIDKSEEKRERFMTDNDLNVQLWRKRALEVVMDLVMNRDMEELVEGDTTAEPRGRPTSATSTVRKPKVEPLAHGTEVEMGARQTRVTERVRMTGKPEGRRSLVDPKGGTAREVEAE